EGASATAGDANVNPTVARLNANQNDGPRARSLEFPDAAPADAPPPDATSSDEAPRAAALHGAPSRRAAGAGATEHDLPFMCPLVGRRPPAVARKIPASDTTALRRASMFARAYVGSRRAKPPRPALLLSGPLPAFAVRALLPSAASELGFPGRLPALLPARWVPLSAFRRGSMLISSACRCGVMAA